MTPPGWLTFAQQASLPVVALSVLLLALVAAIKVWPQLRQMQLEGDTSLRTALMGRIEQLETRVAFLEKTLAHKETLHAVELADVNHDLANERSCLDAAIMLLESSPDKVLDNLARIKEMRRAHRDRVALRRGAREGAMLHDDGTGSEQ